MQKPVVQAAGLQAGARPEILALDPRYPIFHLRIALPPPMFSVFPDERSILSTCCRFLPNQDSKAPASIVWPSVAQSRQILCAAIDGELRSQGIAQKSPLFL